MANTYFSPWELNQYQARKNAADIAYQRSMNQLGYQRDISQEDYNRSIANMTRTWGQAFRNVPNQFVKRNILRSGLTNRGFQNFAYERGKAFGDTELARKRAMDYLTRQQEDAGLIRDFAQTQINTEQAAAEQTRIADILRGLGLGN